MGTALLTALHVYPVKSMRGISLDEAVLTETGLRHDRRWMVIRAGGRFVTQRNEPRLALVRTRLEPDGVVLSFDGNGSITLPFVSRGGAAVDTRVWQDPIEAIDEGDAVADWLTAAMGNRQRLRIVRLAPGFRRSLKNPRRFGPGTTTQFADSAPYLVANEESLDALNRKLQTQGHEPVPMNRFRPNVVLRGLEPFSEHRMAGLSGDGWRLALVDPCERCVVTTIDQQTAERDPAREPYLTLRRINPVAGTETAPAFAQNAKLEAGAGATIRLGAEMSVH
jgi:uncharacterized protein YcbX